MIKLASRPSFSSPWNKPFAFELSNWHIANTSSRHVIQPEIKATFFPSICFLLFLNLSEVEGEGEG